MARISSALLIDVTKLVLNDQNVLNQLSLLNHDPSLTSQRMSIDVVNPQQGSATILCNFYFLNLNTNLPGPRFEIKVVWNSSTPLFIAGMGFQ